MQRTRKDILHDARYGSLCHKLIVVDLLRLYDELADKLPKTADGVSIVLGMHVVTHMMAEGWQPNRVLGMFLREGVLWLDMERGSRVQPCNCYSTREAAEAEGEE